jgi:hypothetical protein
MFYVPSLSCSSAIGLETTEASPAAPHDPAAIHQTNPAATANRWPWLNINVSHHGSFVALAAAARRLAGVDVMTVALPGHRAAGSPAAAADAFLADFENCLTPVEWAAVRGARPAPALVRGATMEAAAAAAAAARLRVFFAFWALKEAYIKVVRPPLRLLGCLLARRKQ